MVAPIFMQAGSAGWNAVGTFHLRSYVFLAAHSVEAMTSLSGWLASVSGSYIECRGPWFTYSSCVPAYMFAVLLIS